MRIAEDDPLAEMCNRRGSTKPKVWVQEHRLIMARHLGRPLLRSETVHHKNGIRTDNRLENLELWNGSHPFGQRVEDQLAWAKEIIALYEPLFGHVQLRAVA